MAEKRTKTISKTVAPKRVERVDADGDRNARVAARAYELFAARGFEHGHDVEDWLAAEAEV
ncbi:MAG TPA: DUF2934 domain-containing protein [Kofleriaceae bacterium]|jgi:hypothetical protein